LLPMLIMLTRLKQIRKLIKRPLMIIKAQSKHSSLTTKRRRDRLKRSKT
jgi:hypothetical protein